MIVVYLLNIEQKNLLIGQFYQENCTFNPIQDVDDNWIISGEEIDQCTNLDFLWIKDLPVINFKRKNI